MCKNTTITLHELERLLNWTDIFNAFPNPVSFHDKNFRIIFMNKAMKQLFPHATIGDKCYKIVHNKDEPPAFCPLKNSYLTQKPQGKVFFHKTLKCQFLVNTSPILSPTGDIIGGIHIINDITETRLLKLKYEHQKSISDFIFKKAPFGIVLVQERKIIEMNEAFENISGYSKDELISKKIDILFKDKETYEQTKKLAKDAFKYGECFTIEEFLKNKDGSLVPIKVTCRKIKELNSTNSYIWIIEDLRQLKELEETKSILTKKLHQAQRLEALGILASGIAHDFNNILTPIMGYVELAQYFAKDDTLKKYLFTISTATTRAKELIENLLKFSKGKSSQLSKIDITKTLKENVKLIKGIVPSSIIIRSKIDEIPYPVLCESAQLNEMVMNLCTNAIQAMGEKGEMEIGCKLVELYESDLKNWPNVKPGKFAKLWVSDTGCGIEQEILERIFEPYFTTKGPDHGTGLGLAMVFNAVNSSNGFIDVKSTPGEGSTFTIYLPVDFQSHDASDDECQMCKEEECLKGVKILLVDDEESVVMIASEFLNLAGATVKAFTNPEDALITLKNKEFIPDILVTDLTMPKLTGDQLAKKAKEIIKDLPVVIITGWGNKEDKIKKEFPVVKKPFKLQDLIQNIKTLLNKNHINAFSK